MSFAVKQVLIVYNPISGRGSALRASRLLERELTRTGRSVQLLESSINYPDGAMVKSLERSDLVVVAGGDGTLRSLLPLISEYQIPVYMLPVGNESLTARMFRMSKHPRDLIKAIDQALLDRCYIGTISDSHFFHMVSVGFDSMVIEAIDSKRMGPIGHIGYIAPSLHSMMVFRPPVIRLEVDGVEKFCEPGYLIISNSGAYARGLKLVPEASAKEPRLAARFFPYRKVADYLPWVMHFAMGTKPSLLDTRLFQGSNFTISTSVPYPVQADGEFVGRTPCTVRAEGKTIVVLQGVQCVG